METQRQKIGEYQRDVPIVDFVCACPHCPLCTNQALKGHSNRKYCCYDAMMEARRQSRIAQARHSGRIPSQIGRPKQHHTKRILYVAHSQDTDLYLMDWSNNASTFRCEFDTYLKSYPSLKILWVYGELISNQDLIAIYTRFRDHIYGQWLRFDPDEITLLKAVIEERIFHI